MAPTPPRDCTFIKPRPKSFAGMEEAIGAKGSGRLKPRAAGGKVPPGGPCYYLLNLDQSVSNMSLTMSNPKSSPRGWSFAAPAA